MAEIHVWLHQKRVMQSLEAIFMDAWFTTYGASCTSNKVQLDVQAFNLRQDIPTYVVSFYHKERCTAH